MADLEQYHAATRDLSNIADILESLARSFARLGNRQIADELREYADSIQVDLRAIDAYTTESLRNLVQEGFNTSGLLLQATLAGLKIGKEATES